MFSTKNVLSIKKISHIFLDLVMHITHNTKKNTLINQFHIEYHMVLIDTVFKFRVLHVALARSKLYIHVANLTLVKQMQKISNILIFKNPLIIFQFRSH